jgi:hypothetical protein
MYAHDLEAETEVTTSLTFPSHLHNSLVKWQNPKGLFTCLEILESRDSVWLLMFLLAHDRPSVNNCAMKRASK